MTDTLAHLESLALAATPGDNPLKHGVAAANWELCAALSPERVLAMIAVVRAADALSTACVSIGHGEDSLHMEPCPVCLRVVKYDAARARLDKEQK